MKGEEIESLECYKINRQIPIKKKIEAISYAKINNNSNAEVKYGVTKKSIRRWRHGLQFKKIDNPEKK